MKLRIVVMVRRFILALHWRAIRPFIRHGGCLPARCWLVSAGRPPSHSSAARRRASAPTTTTTALPVSGRVGGQSASQHASHSAASQPAAAPTGCKPQPRMACCRTDVPPPPPLPRVIQSLRWRPTLGTLHTVGSRAGEGRGRVTRILASSRGRGVWRGVYGPIYPAFM